MRTVLLVNSLGSELSNDKHGGLISLQLSSVADALQEEPHGIKSTILWGRDVDGTAEIGKKLVVYRAQQQPERFNCHLRQWPMRYEWWRLRASIPP